MTVEDHKKRYIELHHKLDELFADYIAYGKGRTTNTIMDLLTWSYQQIENPNHEIEGDKP